MVCHFLVVVNVVVHNDNWLIVLSVETPNSRGTMIKTT